VCGETVDRQPRAPPIPGKLASLTPLGLSLVCSENVQVWRRRFAIPVEMPFRQCLNFCEGLNGNLAAVFADAAQQGRSRPAVGAALPTGVLVAAISPLALQNPLERIIYDPPGRIELGYGRLDGCAGRLVPTLLSGAAVLIAEGSRTPLLQLGWLPSRMGR